MPTLLPLIVHFVTTEDLESKAISLDKKNESVMEEESKEVRAVPE